MSREDRVDTGDVFVEKYNISRVEKALEAMGRNHDERMQRIKTLENEAILTLAMQEELHRLRRCAVCYEFLLGIKERFPPMSDRTKLPSHVESRVQYYRKKYGTVVLGRRIARCVDASKPSKRRSELQGAISKWKLEKKHVRRNSTYQACPSDLRVVLGSDHLHDVDMCNAFPTIAIHMASLYGLKSHALQEYVTRDREGILQEISRTYNVPREIAKNCPLTILHGGSVKSFRREHKIRTKQDVPLMLAMEHEARQLRVAALRSQLELESYVASGEVRDFQINVTGKSDEGEFGSTKCDRSLFSLIMQEREDRILSKMCAYCKEHGVTIESLQFDGLLLTGPPDMKMSKLIKGMEERIKQETGVDMTLCEKPLYRLPFQHIIDRLTRL